MDASRPDRLVRWPLLGQATLAGAALGVLAMVGAGIFLRDAEEILAAAAGVIATVVIALAVGLWAGAPEAAEGASRLRARWFAAGLFTGAAGIFATLRETFPMLPEGAFTLTVSLLVLVAAPVYAIGLLLPALQAWGERWEEAHVDEDEPSDWEPLGTLVVGLLAGIAVGVVTAGLVLMSGLGPGAVLLATGAALIVPTMLPGTTPPETEEQVVYATESPLGSVRVVEVLYPGQRQPERRLYVNGEEESGELIRSGAPTLAYIAASEQWFAETARRGDRFLFLGGGAYTLPRRVAERDPRARITVVELDPEVTRVAYQFFGMRPGYGIRSVHADARAYLEQAEGERYDRIFVDVYGGQESLPYSLVTREAFTLLAQALRSDGMLTLNVIGVTEGEGALRFWSLVRTVADVFPSVALYTHLGRDFPERQNVIVAASLDPDQAFPARAGMFEPWPSDEWPEHDGVVVFQDVFPAAEGGAEKRTAERAAGT
jgi:hypothetical protein